MQVDENARAARGPAASAGSFRLFVSHSSPDDGTRARLTEFVTALERLSGGVVHVLYDAEQITQGDEWRRRIAYMLHACDAAVVLLDEAALQSEWVLAESVFLSIRHAYDPSFRLVPVSFLDKDDLAARRAQLVQLQEAQRRSSWNVARLDDLQYAVAQSPQQVAELVIGAMRATGELVASTSLVELIAEQIAQHLPTGCQQLRWLAAELEDDRIPYTVAEERGRLALALVRRLMREADLGWVREQLDRLGGSLSACQAAAILEILSPLPFDGEAAAVLRRRGSGEPYQGGWVQSDIPDRTVPAYLDRAYLPGRPGAVLTLTNRLSTLASLQSELREEYRKQLPAGRSGRRAPTLTDTDVDRRLRMAEMFVCLPAVDATLLRQLMAEYPKLAFVVHHLSDEAAVPPAGVIRVIPPLKPEQEQTIWSRFDNAIVGLQ